MNSRNFFHLLNCTVLLIISCSFFQKPNLTISPNNWTGEQFTFAELDDLYKKKYSFNKTWSKLHKKRFRPYFKFLDKDYYIVGTYETFKEDFLIIENEKGIRYKMKFDTNHYEKNNLPSYFLFKNVKEDAKSMIGNIIWLNNTFDSKGFFTYTDYNFTRFEPVKIIDIFSYQNRNYDYPIWLKIISFSGYEGYVRYNGEEGRVGIQDHYYLTDPLPELWGNDIIKKILNKKIELGMTDRQVRISIGNPDKLNITSSRHGISKQWIYTDLNGNDIYYQFEYGKLIYINQ